MSGKFQKINFELDKLPTTPTVATQMLELISSEEMSAGGCSVNLVFCMRAYK